MRPMLTFSVLGLVFSSGAKQSIYLGRSCISSAKGPGTNCPQAFHRALLINIPNRQKCCVTGDRYCFSRPPPARCVTSLNSNEHFRLSNLQKIPSRCVAPADARGVGDRSDYQTSSPGEWKTSPALSICSDASFVPLLERLPQASQSERRRFEAAKFLDKTKGSPVVQNTRAAPLA